jgi:predicted AlkP superfamily phosphohydrolase/phosphomutase
VPSDLQYRVKAALPQRWQDELLFRWYAGRRDWRGFRAFAVPNNDSCGAIRIAVRGRDRHGVVEPGAEYDAVCRDLEAAMAELRDPHTRLPLVRQITRVHEVTHGPFRDQLPDLTVLWDQSFPWSAVESPRFGRLDLTRQDARTGSHTDRGFFVASGPGIRAGAVLTGRSIYDIAPTIYRNANVAPPEDLDGAPLPIIESPVRAKAQ